jgi:hypothetical protein
MANFKSDATERIQIFRLPCCPRAWLLPCAPSPGVETGSSLGSGLRKLDRLKWLRSQTADFPKAFLSCPLGFSGRFAVCLSAENHRQIYVPAKKPGSSLNARVADTLRPVTGG